MIEYQAEPSSAPDGELPSYKKGPYKAANPYRDLSVALPLPLISPYPKITLVALGAFKALRGAKSG